MKFLELLLELLSDQKTRRAEFITKTYEPKWKEGLPGFKDFDKFLDHLGKIDPTKNGAYMPWLAKLAITKPEENKTEDLKRVAKDLKTFEEKKSKLENKDINTYKSYQDLYLAVEQFYEKKPKTADERREASREKREKAIRDEITVVYQGPEGWVRIPKTKRAAQFLGQSTRWCTSARSKNMFDNYTSRDSLFIVFNKATSKRFQLHVQDGAFADDKDTHLGVDQVPDWAKKPIANWYKKNNPQLSMKQMITLSSFGEENLAKGTEHEDLFDLMKKYGL